MKVSGRTFVVSGGASGLGRACVEEICRKGGNAAVLDLNDRLGTELVQRLGAAVKFWKTDVLNTDSINASVDGVMQWIQETKRPIGGVIPAAGVGAPATMLDRNNNPLSLEGYDFVMNVNVRGTIDLVRRCLVHMAKVDPIEDGERGVVIMVASSAAFDGQKGQVSYSASKGAVAAMTLPMARDLSRHGIRVCTIAPSLFDSGMTSLLSDKVIKSLEKGMEYPVRAGKPLEFASLAMQCIENIMLNGTVLRLDGAMRMPSKM